MNMKRARFWRNLLLCSALSGTASWPQAHAQEGVSRVGSDLANQPPAAPGAASVPEPAGVAPLTPSPYMPLDPGYNFQRPMPSALPPAYDTLRNSRRDAIGPRFDIGQFLNDRIGVNGGDTNFNFLLPFLMGSEHEVLFIDGRGLATQQGQGGASAGIGYRMFDPELNRIFGISGWVDYDQGHARTYQQAGVSLESLGTWMDVRINGYIPFGRESNLVGHSFVGSPFFGNSNLLINQRLVNESAYHGLDAEMGGPLPVLGRYGISGYVGGYWLDSNTDKPAAGPRVRFEANVTDSFRVNVTASNDGTFGTNAWVNFQMTLPDGRPRRWFRPTAVEDRMLWTANRSYRVQTHTRVDITPTPVLMASGANAGQPVRVVYVDPDRLTNGTGTFSNPLNTFQGFANSAGNSLIVVDGSPSARHVTGNLTLFSDQKLLSTLLLSAGETQLNTNLGLIFLPAVTGFGDASPVVPILSSPAGGTLVTLGGNHTEVAGFTFNGDTGNPAIPNAVGIAGSNLIDFNIHHNNFENYTNGVALTNTTGLGLLQANTFTGTPGTSVDGFRLTNSGVSTLDLFVNAFETPSGVTTPKLPTTANTITGNDNAGVNITARNRAVINAHLVGNTISDNGQGIILDAAATRSVINASIVNNTIDNNRGEDRNRNGILDPGEDRDGDGLLGKGNGVLLMANASTLNAATVGEDTNLNGKLDRSEDKNGNGVLDAGEDTNGNGKLDLSEDKNGNGILDGGYVIAGNTITRNTGDGIAVQSINNSIVNMIAIRNKFGDPTDHSTGNFGRGLSITADSGTVTANIGFLSNEDTNFNGVLDAGEDKNGNGVLDAANPLDGNSFVANHAGGLFVDLSGTAVGNLVALNNTIIGQGGGGLTFQIAGINNGTTAGNPFSYTNNSQSGINIDGVVWDLAPANLQFSTDPTTGTPFSVNTTTSNTTIGLNSVNGTTSPSFAVANHATSLNTQFTGFQVLNGVLDPGEDTNANGVLDTGEDKPGHFNFDVGTSSVTGVPAVLNGSNFIGSAVTATFSSGQVLSGTMQAIAGNATASQFVVTSNNAGSGPGVELHVAGAAALNNPTFVGNNIQFHGGAGFTATATEDGQINNLLLKNNTIQNNGSAANGGGISLNTVAASSAQITGSILNNRLSSNTGPGILVTADSGAINLSQIDTNTLTGNSTSIVLNTLNSGTITTRVTNNTMDNSLSDGFVANANTGTITLNQFSGNTLSNAGGNGIVLSASNAGTILIPASEDLNGNGVLDTGEDTNGNGFLDVGMRNNTVNNPVGNGLFVTGTGTFNLGTVSGMTINRTTSGTGGIVFDVTDSTTTGTFVGNTLLGGAGNTNLGSGFSLTATNGTFDVTIGGPNASDRNLFDRNRGSGIAIIAQNTAVGTYRIENNLITGTSDDSEDSNRNGILDAGEDINGNGILDGVNTPFSGQGIYIGTRTAGVLTPATVVLNNGMILNNVIGDATNTVLGNAGGGILVAVGQQSTLNGMTIDGNLIGSNGTTPAGVTLVDSYDNNFSGITFNRTNDSVIDNVSLTNNQILNNAYDGIYLHASGGNHDLLDFTIARNTIRGNDTLVTTSPTFVQALSGGLHLRTEADSVLNTTITDNLIENNLRNGIRLTSFEASDLDLESQIGTWTKNTIRGNQSHGIAISAVTADTGLPALQIGLNGIDVADGRSFGNSITDNLQGGVEINTGGNLELNNNIIARNGGNAGTGVAADTNGTGGVDINMLGGGNVTDDSFPLRMRLINNVIQANIGDGFEVVASNAQSGTFGIPQSVSLTVLGNRITDNTARGIDLLTQGSGTINMRLGDGTLAGGNTIATNGQEGVYSVTTPSLTQSQQVSANTALAINGPLVGGAPVEFPNTVLDIRQNNITGNNILGTPVGNVSSFFSAAGVVIRDGTGGTVTTRISENFFSGNNGDDVLFETYRATANPANPGLIPFANLNVVFQNDVGQSVQPNQINAFYTFNNVIFDANQALVEAGFNTTGFANGGPGGSGEFGVPFPWTVVPSGTFSNNSFPNFLFP